MALNRDVQPQADGMKKMRFKFRFFENNTIVTQDDFIKELSVPANAITVKKNLLTEQHLYSVHIPQHMKDNPEDCHILAYINEERTLLPDDYDLSNLEERTVIEIVDSATQIVGEQPVAPLADLNVILVPQHIGEEQNSDNHQDIPVQ